MNEFMSNTMEKINPNLTAFAKFAPIVWVVYGIYMLVTRHFQVNGFINAFIVLSLYFSIGTAISSFLAFIPSLPFILFFHILLSIMKRVNGHTLSAIVVIYRLLYFVFFLIIAVWTIFISNWTIKTVNGFFRSPAVQQQNGINEIPKQYQKDRDAFVNSIISLNEANKLTQPENGVISSASNEKEVLSLVDKGVSLSANVSDDFLNMLHPELKNMYRNKLITGTQIWKEGIIKKDVLKQMNGARLDQEWSNWFEKHKKDVGDKIF
jgi:hypothetical protein